MSYLSIIIYKSKILCCAEKSSSVLPQSSVLATLTGHALWQTFVNDEAVKEGDSDKRQTSTKAGDSYKQMLQVNYTT